MKSIKIYSILLLMSISGCTSSIECARSRNTFNFSKKIRNLTKKAKRSAQDIYDSIMDGTEEVKDEITDILERHKPAFDAVIDQGKALGKQATQAVSDNTKQVASSAETYMQKMKKSMREHAQSVEDMFTRMISKTTSAVGDGLATGIAKNEALNERLQEVRGDLHSVQQDIRDAQTRFYGLLENIKESIKVPVEWVKIHPKTTIMAVFGTIYVLKKL